MRRRFRPTLESLDLRITPSGPSMIYTGPDSHQTIPPQPNDPNVNYYGDDGTVTQLGSNNDGGGTSSNGLN